MLSVPALNVAEDDWSEVAPVPESATHVSMKFGRFKDGIASLWCNSTAAESLLTSHVVMSGRRKWNVLDQFPIWLVVLVALTLQYQVLPVSNSSTRSKVLLLMSNPVSVQLVAIIRSGESKELDVSISTDHPPTVTPPDVKFQFNCGL